jgi:uncharacterized protein (TIGR03435 family)
MMLRNLVVLWAAVAAVYGQSFEAASIKVSAPKSERGSQGGPGSARYSFHRGSLLDFLALGFDVEYRQVSGKIDLDKVEFDLDATLPPGTTREQLHAMIRNLLAERFHLKQHIETREFSGYELVVAKTGHKLLPEGTAPEHLEGFPDLTMSRADMRSFQRRLEGGYLLVRMRGRLQTVAKLAEWIQPPDDGPVIDKTGLAGRFDVAIEYTQELGNALPDTAAQPSVIPDLFTALQQQLGLQLIRKKIPLPVVVVDSVDKLPAEN